jgi:3'5'-cyclic nucleotide phosphodiesterase
VNYDFVFVIFDIMAVALLTKLNVFYRIMTGKMQTYFVEPKLGRNSVSSSEQSSNELLDDRRQGRLVNWTCDIFEKMICQIISRRAGRSSAKKQRVCNDSNNDTFLALMTREGETILDQVAEIIELPEFDHASVKKSDVEVELSDEVREELQNYIVWIATLYKKNPFHNFEHAVHVTMSVVKLLSRIIAPEKVIDDLLQSQEAPSRLASSLHDHTYGITSDPLTQFACLFSSLIHDVDHTGVPNTQLVKENVNLSQHYNGRSVAEQNSIDVAWQLLMRSDFRNLRNAICETESEMKRFRQLVINSVMATDIMDKDLSKRRNISWEKAFQDKSDVANLDRNVISRKATIVIEHLIQASDVAHTMQHWHIYRMWNERLFEEMYMAYSDGRAEKNPVEFWYKGEMGFFDFYIIPLTEKLRDCGVFGVSSQEFMNYAVKNREEWEARGEEIVASMAEKMRKMTAYKESVSSSDS